MPFDCWRRNYFENMFAYNRQARILAIESALQIMQFVVYVCHATKTWRNWHAYTHMRYAAMLVCAPETIAITNALVAHATVAHYFFVRSFTCEVLIHCSINLQRFFFLKQYHNIIKPLKTFVD